MNCVEEHQPAIEALCRQYAVRALYVFGSVVRGEATLDSDIDFIVQFDRDGYEGAFEQLMSFQEGMEQLLNRRVDILVQRQFRNVHFNQEVEETRQLVYAA